MPCSYPTPADPRRPHRSGRSVLASGTPTPSPSALLLLTGLYQALASAVSLTAYVIPCVRFNRFVRLLTHLLNGCNTRYEWLVRPCPIETCTQSETSSFTWRSGVSISTYATNNPTFALRPPTSCRWRLQLQPTAGRHKLVLRPPTSCRWSFNFNLPRNATT